METPRLRMFAGPNGSGKSTKQHSHRAYLFDNSRHGGERLWVAEITDGVELETKCTPLPLWFQDAVWNKINPATS